jgi:hypothetical protein
MKYLVASFSFILPVLLLSACASLGLAPAQSFEQKLAYGYGTYTAVQAAAAQAMSDHVLPSADGSQVLKLADESRALLDAAKAANKVGDLTTANGKLVLATQVLVQLQSYLRSNR